MKGGGEGGMAPPTLGLCWFDQRFSSGASLSQSGPATQLIGKLTGRPLISGGLQAAVELAAAAAAEAACGCRWRHGAWPGRQRRFGTQLPHQSCT